MLAVSHNNRSQLQQYAHYDWQPDLPDYRDRILAVKPQTLWRMPYQVDLRSNMPPVSPAHRLGNCAIGSLSEAIAYSQIFGQALSDETKGQYQTFKEQAAGRLMDAGAPAQIRKGLKEFCKNTHFENGLLTAIDGSGIKTGRLRLQEKPIDYFRIEQNLNHLKACLSEGHPFVFGFSVYDAFENPSIAETGDLNLPGKSEYLIGGHTALCVGYDDNTERFILRNTCWGNNWGKEGHFTVPYSYLQHQGLARDFWTIRITPIHGE